MKTRIIAASALALILAAVPLLAHHTAAYVYDISKPVPLSGTVTVVEWKQPHVLVHVDVVKADSGVASWIVEMSGPQSGMYRNGLRPENFVKPGDPISMTVCIAKDGTNAAYVHAITVPSALQNKVGTC
jgi:hypothetical protein